MPLYPFTCQDCSTTFDALVAKATDRPTAECPACGGANVVRGFGVPSAKTAEPTNCRGDGPPCGAFGCGRAQMAAG
jgi:putative FmdB family regulatory protein